MIKNVCRYLLITLMLSPEYSFTSSFSSNEQLQEKIDEIAEVASQLEPYNTFTIENYQSITTDTEISMSSEQKKIFGGLIVKLLKHEHNKTALTHIANDEVAIIIKNSWLNAILLNGQHQERKIKTEYDTTFGQGKFHEIYGKDENSATYNTAHSFAEKLLQYRDNNISINGLKNLANNAEDETSGAWSAIAYKIEIKKHS